MDFSRLERCGVVPVVKIENPADAVPLAKALIAGGVDCIEVTFRTASAAESIAAITREVPEMLTGAGTVLNAEQFKAAASAGAKFIVSPGLSADVVRGALDAGLPVLPGIVTPTEIIAALDLGLKRVKFFPAETFGGIAAIKALSAPFAGVKFMPTGGVNPGNLASYLAVSAVFAVGGTWIATEKLINEGDWGEIARLACEARALFEKARGAV